MATQTPQGHGTILVLTAQQKLAKDIQLVLGDAGYRVYSSSNPSVIPSEAATADLIVVDCNECTGEATVRHLKELRRNLPSAYLILLSRVPVSKSGHMYLQSEFNVSCVLVQPVAAEELVGQIKACLD